MAALAWEFDTAVETVEEQDTDANIVQFMADCEMRLAYSEKDAEDDLDDEDQEESDEAEDDEAAEDEEDDESQEEATVAQVANENRG